MSADMRALVTRDERLWMNTILEIGCCVCHRAGHPKTPGVVHHLLRSGRRMGHLYTICLCEPGHHQGCEDSRHPWRKRFEEAHGTEKSLWKWSRNQVALLIGFINPADPSRIEEGYTQEREDGAGS